MTTAEFDELWASWVNGNRSDVADAVAQMPRSAVVRFVLHVLMYIASEDYTDLSALATMLANRGD